MLYRFFFIIICTFLFASCDMDSYLFNIETVDSYTISNSVIPDSARQFISFSSNENTLYGYYVKSSEANPAVNGYTVLYFHGNKHNLNEYWDRIEFLYTAGFSVLIFDYQGFGKSEGTCSESALYTDARAARTFLLSITGINTSRIIYYGYSLGCVPAVDLAVQFPPSKLILEAGFASGEALIQSGALIDIPGSFLLEGEFNNKNKIKNIHIPVAVLHGEKDKFIDINKNGAIIFANANNPKVFKRVPEADHTNVPQTMTLPVYYDFLNSIVAWSF